MARGGVPPIHRGSDNHAWTGDAATKQAVHKRLNRERGRAATHIAQMKKKGLKAWTIRKALTPLSGAYRVAVRDGQVDSSPVGKLLPHERPQSDAQEKRILSRDGHKAYDRRLLVASYWKARECGC